MPTWLIVGWAVVMTALAIGFAFLSWKVRQIEREQYEVDQLRARIERQARAPRDFRRQPKDAA
jgi:hypothetical protein